MEACSRHSPQRAPGRAHVLVACTGPAREVLAQVLDGWAEWTPVYTLEDALRALDAHPDLVVCTLRFDDSRMLDLAAEIAHHGDVPLLCCRVGVGELPEHSLAAAVMAAENLGAVGFVDFPRLVGESGEEAAVARFRSQMLSAFA
jgi:hypothetical protein